MPAMATTHTKWWILLWYSYLSALQSLLWMTFSSVPAASRAFLSVDDATLDLLLDWGPLAFCIVVFPATWLLAVRSDGIRLSVVAAAILCFGASVLRAVPALLSDAQRVDFHAPMMACVHIGQFINAGVAPLVVASPAFLSFMWFPEDQRNTATAVANVASALGRAIGFFLGPALVSASSDLPRLLFSECALALLPVLAVLWHYPALPSTPPSEAAAEELARLFGLRKEVDSHSQVALLLEGGEGVDGEGGIPGAKGPILAPPKSSLRDALAEVVGVLRTPSFALLGLAGGLQMAVYGAWSGVLPTVLTPRFSSDQAGTFGSVNTFAGIVGGVLIAFNSDAPWLRQHLRAMLIALCVSSALVFGVLALALRPISLASLSPLGFWPLLLLCLLAGFLRGGTDPLFFEAAAEVSHPHPASTAGGVVTFFYHIVLVACLSAPPSVMEWSMSAMALCLLVSAALLVPVSIRYTRR